MSDNLGYLYIADLVQKAQDGDSNAFAELYAATYEKQYRFSYRYLKDEYLAQDALQECYILVLKNITKLRDPLLFMSWLNQINFRVCFNMKWKQERYNKELLDYDSKSDGFELKSPNPEERAELDDEKRYIIKQIMELPAPQSQAIIMKYYQNMKLEDIAHVMEISRSTVKRYLAAGRKSLGLVLDYQEEV